MKATYQTPATIVEQAISLDNLMELTASTDGENVLDYGGSTSGGGITTGDSKHRDSDMELDTHNGWTDGLW